MTKNLNFVCYKWGNKYPASYVNKLYAMVKRNIKIPFTFYCVTDNPDGIMVDVKIADMPTRKLPGNGPKLYTFSKEFLGLNSDEFVVSLDLDIVVTSNLDFLAERPEQDFLIARHRIRKGPSRVHGAVYRIRVGSHSRIWENFLINPEEYALLFPGKHGYNAFSEQSWIEEQMKSETIEFFPSNKVISFRADCNSKPKRKFLFLSIDKSSLIHRYLVKHFKASLPNIGEAIVSFSGKVNPEYVMKTHTITVRHAPFIEKFWRL